MEDLEEAVFEDHVDVLAGQITTHVIVDREQADGAVRADSAAQSGLGFPFALGPGPFGRLEGLGPSPGKACGRRNIAHALMLSFGVVVPNPGVKTRLCLGQRREDLVVEVFAFEGLVEALHLAGGRWGPRGGEAVFDAVFLADAVEHDDALAGPAARSE